MSVTNVSVEPMSSSRSKSILEQGRLSLAGGDSSTMRVLPYHLPLVADRGEGAYVWDADGNRYLDLNMAYGPLLFGHRPKRVIAAVRRQVEDHGSMLGFPTEVTIRTAEKLKRLYPSMELVRFSNSGTEVVAHAIRLARTVTSRSKIILFEGHYHGWSDAVFHRYHAAPEELPDGDIDRVPPGTSGMNGAPHDVLLLPWNDLDALTACLERYGQQVAAMIMEPIMCNSGCIPPAPGFLRDATQMARGRGALVIFDEVITGLRVAPGGAQELYSVRPDITVLSKALGGGWPVAAFGASREIMDPIVRGTMFHGGVYSGNAGAVAATEAVLDEIIAQPAGIYEHLNAIGQQLASGLHEIMRRMHVPHVVQHVGPVVSLFLTKTYVEKLTNYRDVHRHCDFEKYIQFQHHMQGAGIYFHPCQYETMFLSTAHTAGDIAAALETFERGAEVCLAR